MGEVLRMRRSRMIATDEHIPSHLDQGASVAGLFRRRARRGREDDYGGEDEHGRQAGRHPDESWFGDHLIRSLHTAFGSAGRTTPSG